MSDTEPCPPMEEAERQLTLAFMDEFPWSKIEGQPLNLPNPPGQPCYCSGNCHLNSHKKEQP